MLAVDAQLSDAVFSWTRVGNCLGIMQDVCARSAGMSVPLKYACERFEYNSRIGKDLHNSRSNLGVCKHRAASRKGFYYVKDVCFSSVPPDVRSRGLGSCTELRHGFLSE